MNTLPFTKRVAARLVNGEAPVDLSKWTLNAVSDAQEFMEKVVLAAASEALRYAIEGSEGNPAAMFATLKSSAEEPLFFEVLLPLVTDDIGPQFTFTLRETLELELEMLQMKHVDFPQYHEEQRHNMLRILDELRSLTVVLEQALSEPNTENAS